MEYISQKCASYNLNQYRVQYYNSISISVYIDKKIHVKRSYKRCSSSWRSKKQTDKFIKILRYIIYKNFLFTYSILIFLYDLKNI